MTPDPKIAQKTAQLLLEIEAITLRPNDPFEFTSGISSPIYIDNRLTISFPEARAQIVEFYVQLLKEEIGLDQIDLLSGTSTAAIPWAAFIAQETGLPMVYVRGKKKGHGKENQIEGQVEPGAKTLVIEDHISTGGSLIDNAQAIRAKGGEVDSALAITTFLFTEAAQKFDRHQINLITLTDYQAIISAALDRGLITDKEKKLVENWNQDPRNWP